MVTVLPPMASLTTTLALSGSTPSICQRDGLRTRKGDKIAKNKKNRHGENQE